MSGFILPGQENKPKSDIKIELPSSVSSRRREQEKKPEVPAVEATAAAPAASDAAAAPSGRGGQPMPDFLFPPTPVQIRCPNCGNTYAVPLFSIIDLGANPELKGPLLSGQIHIAACQKCGAGGPLSAPLLVHEPGHQFLGVFAPMQGQNVDVQQQKVIGDLTQSLMRKLPQDGRKGYMLQPKQFGDWNQFLEQLWGFEGVTPEMLRRQRNQSELLQRLISLANDRKAMEIALQQRGGDLIDRDFFALLDRFIMMASSQGQNPEPFVNLRTQLLDMTEAGRQLKARQEKVRGILQGLGANTTREQVLERLLAARQEEDGPELMPAVAAAVAPLLDYQFLMAITQRLEEASAEQTRQHLEEVRQLVLTIQEQQQQAQQAMVQQVQQILQQVLQAPDMKEALRQFGEYVDETFLAILATNIQAAQRNGSTAAARRLQQVYEAAVGLLQENMPDEMRLINDLLSAPDKAALSRLLQEHRPKLTKEFVASLKVLETDMRDNNRDELADRIKALRAQITLMV